MKLKKKKNIGSLRPRILIKIYMIPVYSSEFLRDIQYKILSLKRTSRYIASSSEDIVYHENL